MVTLHSLEFLHTARIVRRLRLRIFSRFLEGCDASILILSTSGNRTERDAVENNIPQQAFGTITTIKSAVESACPGVVSCADIIALAARDAVVFLSGPFWQVPLGRRDTLISRAENVQGNIPTSNLSVSQLLAIFTSKGLDIEDLVALSDLQEGRGLLFSDQTLFVDNLTSSRVNLFASSQSQFFQSFVNSMIKMSSIGVLMGNNGEIRINCTIVNPSQSMQIL